ncbi:MAG: extracellular solute-binding protein [Chloroflexi bacterium]|nr:extracellular solute-binding protein [Chloroflexota bacterium]
MVKTITLLAVVCFGLIACVSGQAPAPVIQGPEAKTGERTVQQAWETDWQKTLTAAKKEGRVIIWSFTGPEVRQGFGQAFKDKFGLEIEWMVGRPAELNPKLFQERRAGLYLADVYLGATGEQVTVFKPAGILEPIRPQLVLPEVLDQKAWYGGQLPFLDNEKSYILYGSLSPNVGLVINTTMVRPEDISSYDKLLEPRWKDKILLSDPLKASLNNTIVNLFAIKGTDYLRKLAANNPMIIDNLRVGVEWVARGRYPVWVGGARQPAAVEMERAGAPVKRWSPPDGVAVTAALAISSISQAPHPAASKVFLNWVLTREAQTIYSRLNDVHMARVDVPTDHLSPEEIRDPSVKYFLTATEDAFLKLAEYHQVVPGIFGPLMK